jgi:hypothetical protein
VFGLRRLGDVGVGVLQGDEPAAGGLRYRLIEYTFPAAISHQVASMIKLEQFIKTLML